MTTNTPSPWIRGAFRDARPYTPPPRDGDAELLLDLNEGAPLTPRAWLDRAAEAIDPATARRYPSNNALEARLADRLGLTPDRLVVTNGGDDAIHRVCAACLASGDEMVLPIPSFEMIARSAEIAGGTVKPVAWDERSFPLDATLNAVNTRTRVIAVVSPNNPTGAVIAADQLAQLAGAAPRALLMVDLAYTEFADEDLTPLALSLPNAVIVRTFSKAFGMAALRVGYAAGPAATINAIRAVGSPFPCSAFSLAAADAVLDLPADAVESRIARVRTERAELTTLLGDLGVTALPSQANFVLARFPDATAVCESLARRGIRVRRFAQRPLADALRIGLPGDGADFGRLTNALREVLTPTGAAR